MKHMLRNSFVGAVLHSARVGARSMSSFKLPSSLYFKQLLPGRDIAMTDDHPMFGFARQMSNFMYLIGDKATGEAYLVDGAWDIDGIFEQAERDNVTITQSIATHYHWDHIGGKVELGSDVFTVPGIADLQARDLPLHMPSWELKLASDQTGVPEHDLIPITDKQCMSMGSFELEFIHTPGHSPGSTCIKVSEDGKDLLLITGDTVFPGSCGRLDLPGSDPHIMYDSLQKLRGFDKDVLVFPGHSYGGEYSTIGQEMKSGLLREIQRADWNTMMA